MTEPRLSVLSVAQLRQQAEAAGVGAELIEAARDDDAPKEALLELVGRARAASAAEVVAPVQRGAARTTAEATPAAAAAPVVAPVQRAAARTTAAAPRPC